MAIAPPAAVSPHPNELDHDKLFVCDPSLAFAPAEASSYRLTPSQLEQRWYGRIGREDVYAKDDRYDYSTDRRDVVIDDAAAETLLQKAMALGKWYAASDNTRSYCMRRSTYRDKQGLEAPSKECLEEWMAESLKQAWQRPPTSEEVAHHKALTLSAIAEHGTDEGLALGLALIYTTPSFLFREQEADFKPSGPGQAGTLELTSWTMANALAMAVTDLALIPNRYRLDRRYDDIFMREALDELALAATHDEVQTSDQLKFWTKRLMEAAPAPDPEVYDRRVLPSAIARFFREYFGYDKAPYVFKAGGIPPGFRRINDKYSPGGYVQSAEDTVAWIVSEDKEVFGRLLAGDSFFMPISSRPMQHWGFNLPPSDKEEDYKALTEIPAKGWTRQDRAQRAGMLTHPAWLVAHSGNQHTDPHPVHRGIWMRAHLFCQNIPDLPMDVDAVLPEHEDQGVRARLDEATDILAKPENVACWECHKLMNPLGIPLERYSHYGRWRQTELTSSDMEVPLSLQTRLIETHDPALEGKIVRDAPEMMRLLAASPRVEQCMIRHMFRYFMGRSERYEDACLLSQMHQSYQSTHGSFKETLSVLTSSPAFSLRHQDTP